MESRPPCAPSSTANSSRHHTPSAVSRFIINQSGQLCAPSSTANSTRLQTPSQVSKSTAHLGHTNEGIKHVCHFSTTLHWNLVCVEFHSEVFGSQPHSLPVSEVDTPIRTPSVNPAPCTATAPNIIRMAPTTSAPLSDWCHHRFSRHGTHGRQNAHRVN